MDLRREMEEQRNPVVGGVDTHLDVHVCVAVCSVTMCKLDEASFPVSTAGYTELLEWLESFGPVARVGIEGTGTYGGRVVTVPRGGRRGGV
jgi:hypothetical protein